MQISSALAECLADPSYRHVRYMLENDCYLMKGGAVKRGLAATIYNALGSRISSMLRSAEIRTSNAEVFGFIVAEYGLPTAFKAGTFYSWVRRRGREAVQAAAGLRQKLSETAAQPVVNVNPDRTSPGSVSQTPSRPVPQSGTQQGPLSSVKPPVSKSSEDLAEQIRQSRQEKLFNYLDEMKKVTLNAGTVYRSTELSKGGNWTHGNNCSGWAMPGEVTNYGEVKALRDRLVTPVPTPRFLRPLTPDDPLWPFGERWSDPRGEFTFLVDEDGYVYDPCSASPEQAGVPVPLTEDLGLGRDPQLWAYEDRSRGQGAFIRREHYASRVFAVYRDSGEPTRQRRSSFRFINVKQGIRELPRKPIGWKETHDY